MTSQNEREIWPRIATFTGLTIQSLNKTLIDTKLFTSIRGRRNLNFLNINNSETECKLNEFQFVLEQKQQLVKKCHKNVVLDSK